MTLSLTDDGQWRNGEEQGRERVSSEQDARTDRRWSVENWEEQGWERVSSEKDACTDTRTGANTFLQPHVV